MSNERYEIDHPKASTGNKGKLLYVSTAKYDSDWHSVKHTHHCSELFYIVEGEGQFFIEDKTYPVSINDLVIVNPHILHTEISLNGSSFEYIVLGIEGLELPATDQNKDMHFCIVNFESIRDTILFYLQKLLYEVEEKIPGHETVCQNLMEILVVLLERQTNFSTTLAPVSKKTSRLSGYIRRYIDHHYKENITLDHLAEISHVSKFHLAHAFTEEYGISPINYMISKRIEEGEYLLKTTDFSLALISHICGFSSPSYFSQIFKKQNHCSPREFRKKSKQVYPKQEVNS